MDTQTITQSLAYISWVLMLGIGLGSLALVVLLRQATDATKGFLGFTAICAGLSGLLVWFIDDGLPDPAQLHIDAAPGLDGYRSMAIAAFTILALVAGARMLRGHRALILGVGGVIAGVIAEALGALGWATGPVEGVPLLVQLVALSAVTGGSVAAVILAHWYLVTPRISEVPLVLTTRLLAGALGIQLLLFLVWVATGIPTGPPFGALTGSNAVLVWLRLIVGIVFPLVLAVMAYRTALTRSMESATGLLYIELTLVLASTIVAAGLAMGTGMLGVMRIRVRLFAMQRQQLGVRELPLEVVEGSTVADAWAALAALHPVLAPAGPTLRFARNAIYADPGEVLADGDELALIPPVAGGSGEPAGSDVYRRIELHPAPFGDALLGELRRTVATPADGAVVLFLGQTRATPGTPAPGQEAEAARHAGREVEALEYEAFEPMALAVLEQVADEIAARFGVTRVAILHRTGEVPLGEASVVIAVASGHRGAGFEACRYAIEELKARAPIWKSERFTDGSVWIGAPARTGPDPTG